MARADAPRERLGEMLLSVGLITQAQLDEALLAQQRSHLPLGKQLVALGAVNEACLVQVLSNQLSIPRVSLERVVFSADLLARIPAELADRYSVLPIYVRRVRGRGATLYIAMDDPTNEAALEEIAEAASMAVRPMIAPPSEIRRTIEQRYFGAPTPSIAPGEEAPRLPVTSARRAGSTKPQAESEKQKPQRARKPPPPPGPPSTRVEGVVAIEQYETPSQPPPAMARTLTLLDGTQIKLPTPRGAREAPTVTTVRQVIRAIRGARSEAGSDEPMRWHDIVQTVLDTLDARGIRLTRQELMDAWIHHAKRSQPKAQ